VHDLTDATLSGETRCCSSVNDSEQAGTHSPTVRLTTSARTVSRSPSPGAGDPARPTNTFGGPHRRKLVEECGAARGHAQGRFKQGQDLDAGGSVDGELPCDGAAAGTTHNMRRLDAEVRSSPAQSAACTPLQCGTYSRSGSPAGHGCKRLCRYQRPFPRGSNHR
jgi:hypothetical protein